MVTSKETTEKTVDQLVANIKNCMQIVSHAAATGGTTDSRGTARLTQSLHRDVDELVHRLNQAMQDLDAISWHVEQDVEEEHADFYHLQSIEGHVENIRALTSGIHRVSPCPLCERKTNVV